MALKELGMETLNEGKAIARVDEAIAELVADVMKRPRIKKARKVLLEIELSPEESGEEVLLGIDYSVKLSRPGTRGVHSTAMIKGGKALVSGFDPEVRQTRIEEVAGVMGEEGTGVRPGVTVFPRREQG